jgi:hypothetical protein
MSKKKILTKFLYRVGTGEGDNEIPCSFCTDNKKASEETTATTTTTTTKRLTPPTRDLKAHFPLYSVCRSS